MYRKSVDAVAINPELSAEQINEVKSLLKEYSDTFTDVLKITHLAKHRVDLTQREPVRSKIYPTPYKMKEVISNWIDDMLAKGIIERSEAAYASPLVLVKKPDGTYRTCVNFSTTHTTFRHISLTHITRSAISSYVIIDSWPVKLTCHPILRFRHSSMTA